MQNDDTGDKSKPKDPNRVQPMPLPDDPLKNKELILPPLPVLPKKDSVSTPQTKVTPATPINDQMSTEMNSHQTLVQNKNLTTSANRLSQNVVKIDNRRPDDAAAVAAVSAVAVVSAVVSPQDDSNEFANGDLGQNHEDQNENNGNNGGNEMVFSTSELQEIENIMTKPKTINKRSTQRVRSRGQQPRTISQNTRKNSSTIVIKEEYADHPPEDE